MKMKKHRKGHIGYNKGKVWYDNPKDKYRIKHIIKNCEWCNKEFHPFHKSNRFCSYKCAVKGRPGRTKWNKKKVKCNNCGKEKLISLSVLKKYKYHFCGKKCQNQYYKKLFSGSGNLMWGKTHTDKIKNEQSKRMIKRIREYPFLTNYNGKGKGGKRQDLNNQYFRSSWEANYARFLNYMDIKWIYEAKTFVFPVKRGTMRYTPDFYLPDKNEYHEVKGWMTQKSRTALKRMAKYYPNVRLILIDKMKYKKIEHEFREKINNWEGRS